MIPTPLLFRHGDILDIRAEGGVDRALWRVLYRKGGGYETKPLSDGADRFWSDAELDLAYGERRLKVVHYDQGRLGKKVVDVLSRTWEYWPEDVRREALRRLEFVRRVDAIMPHERVRSGDEEERARRRSRCDAAAARLDRDEPRETSLQQAYARARDEVWSERNQEWESEERDAHQVYLKEFRLVRRRRPVEKEPEPKLPTRPSSECVRAWWTAWDDAEDVRALIPRDHDKGDRRPRFKEETADGTTTYRLMAFALDEYMDKKRPNAKVVYEKRYKPLCDEHKLPKASYKTFNLFRRMAKNAYETVKERFGARAAKLRFKVSQRTRPPERPLEEVEVDHWLIDVVVRHPITKRKLGRPWMTLLIDRATRAILGCHLSFEQPSHASLQRALAHAFWRKDVSGIEGLENDWPMHGVPFWIFTDNGREFRSKSLRLAEAMLDFGVVNLPERRLLPPKRETSGLLNHSSPSEARVHRHRRRSAEASLLRAGHVVIMKRSPPPQAPAFEGCDGFGSISRSGIYAVSTRHAAPAVTRAWAWRGARSSG